MVAFADLSTALQTRGTVNVINVLNSRLRLATALGDDPIPIIQEQGMHLESTIGASNLQLSPLTLDVAGSNLAVGDIRDMLLTLGVAEPWRHIDLVAQAAGFPVINLQNAFRELLRNRNQAAHDGTYEATSVGVRSMANTIAAIAFAFDALGSRACRLVSTGDQNHRSGNSPIRSQDIRFIYICQVGGRWKVFLGNVSGTTRRVLPTVEDALIFASQHSIARNHEVLVVGDGSSPPSRWATTDLP